MAKTITEIKSLARAYTEQAVQTLGGIMGEQSYPPASRVAAATALLNRGWGMPTQPIAGDDDADAIRIETIRRIIVKPGHTDGGSVPAAVDPE